MSSVQIRRLKNRTPDPMPIIRRTRSWRGVMQVRFDDQRADRNSMAMQLVFWSPLRIFGCIFASTSFIYVYMGHDQFMHLLMGYESEMQFETKVNPTDNISNKKPLENDRGWRLSIRNLEQPLHPTREFDVMKDTFAATSNGSESRH